MFPPRSPPRSSPVALLVLGAADKPDGPLARVGGRLELDYPLKHAAQDVAGVRRELVRISHGLLVTGQLQILFYRCRYLPNRGCWYRYGVAGRYP